ncbi:MAG: hypothetical protein R3B45_09230 [Bdellovibrionota bacterium]
MVLFKRKILSVFIIPSGLIFYAACGEKNTDTDDDKLVISQGVPGNSSGSKGSVQVDFNSANSSLSLTEESSLMIGDSIELTQARFSIAAIKIKTEKELSDEEAEIEKIEKEHELEEVEKVEKTESDDDSAALVDGNEAKPSKDGLASKKDEFKAEQENEAMKEKDRDKSLKFSGPYVYDALAGVLEGDAIEPTEMVDGSYQRIEFKLKRNWDVDEEDPLFGNVFVIQGNRIDGEDKVPFDVYYHIATNFRLHGDGDFFVEAGTDNELEIVFDLQKWFDGVDLSGVEIADGENKIVIDKDSNHEILKAIRKNISKY